MLIDSIRDILIELWQSTIAKVIVFALLAGGLLAGFISISTISEESACKEYGGKYIDGICTADDPFGDYVKNYIFVTGNTANSPKPTLGDHLSKNIKNSILKNQEINVKLISVAKGNRSETIKTDRNTSGSVDETKKIVDSTINIINNNIGRAPTSDGATYFEAITKAGREAASINKQNSDGSMVVVFGSGLSDGGVLNFAENGLLYMETSYIVDEMKKSGQLNGHYLDGVKITWYDIGGVIEPQEQLSSADIEKLQDIYGSVFEELGAEIDFVTQNMPSDKIANNKHTVKTTTVKGSVIPPPIPIGDDDISFSADSAKITDEVKARASLSKVFVSAEQNPGLTITVTGYMASGNCSGVPNNPDLALNRARAVQEFLVKYGVKNSIEVINGGVYNPNESECENNKWKSELAVDKRKVIIEFK